MSTSPSKWFREHAATFLVTGVFFVGLLYAVTTSWKNEERLGAQSEQLGQIRGDLKDVKKSLIAFLLNKDPNVAEIVKGLVSDSRTVQGIEQFKAGRLEEAYAMWLPSAKAGNHESAFAISAANLSLKRQAEDVSLPPEERAKAQTALAHAPIVEWKDDTFIIRHRQ